MTVDMMTCHKKKSTNLLVKIGTVCYVFKEDVAAVLDDIADRLEVGVPLLQDVGDDVKGDGELGAWVLRLAVEAEVVVVVLEARQGGLDIKLPLP